ncbi:MAG: ABC transporter ATP-binding protein [Alphaproteobacteria bacterium]|nr:MAG: ABC transporter ATP-binding protein [Alphaproteobacteria bacterium]
MATVIRDLGQLWQLVGAVAGARRWRLAVLIILGAVAEGAGLAVLVPVVQALGIGGLETGWPLPLALGVGVAISVAAAVIIALRSFATTDLRLAVVDHLRLQLHQAWLQADLATQAAIGPARITDAVIQEVGRTGLAMEALTRVASFGAVAPVLLVLTVLLSPALAGAALLFAVCLIPLAIAEHRRARRIGLTLSKAGQRMQGWLADDLSLRRAIKSYRLDPVRHAGFLDAARAMTEAQRISLAESVLGRLATRVAATLALAGLILGAVSVIATPLAEALVVALGFARLAQITLALLDAWRQVSAGLPGYLSYAATLAACRAGAEPAPVEPAPRLTTHLAFQAVRVAYPGGVTVGPITLRWPARHLILLTGPSGVGKSTLADVALGLVEPSSGCLLIDDQPVLGGTRAAWRQHTALVPQDPALFDGTIGENLRLVAPTASHDDVWAALRDAQAEFVARLPRGLESPVGIRGERLSGGERQRIAIARALLRSPDLLVLDEPTAALDATSEAAIFTLALSLTQRCTVVLITHRSDAVPGDARIHRVDLG